MSRAPIYNPRIAYVVVLLAAAVNAVLGIWNRPLTVFGSLLLVVGVIVFAGVELSLRQSREPL